MKKIGFLLFALSEFACWSGCGISIETGPPTAEEAARASEGHGKGVRAEWRNRLVRASPIDKVMMFKTFIDSVSTRYVSYGHTVADQWRQGNEGRGREIPDSEMRDMVDRWSETDRPLLQAYEDVVEFGLDHIRETGYLDEAGERLLKSFVDHFYDVCGAVFYPTGTVADYEYRLVNLQVKTEELSGELEADLTKYR